MAVFRSAMKSLILASASVSDMPPEIKNERTEEAGSPQMIFALASVRRLFGSSGSPGLANVIFNFIFGRAKERDE